ncbi:MAG: DNA primase [Myxococcales bacterium]
MIPEEKVREILERTDIVALVARSVELKRAGRSLKGLCPFHGERTPSFMVSPDRRRFKCFGCGAGGDAISFVMRQGGVGFVEAARSLAAQAGVRLDSTGDDRQMREKLELRRIHDLAARFYAERLWDERAGKAGRAHLTGRGVSEETARAFGLGYAPASWNELAGRCVREGVFDLALRAGLLSPRKDAPGAAGPKQARDGYDFFRGRLMIPIRSPEGQTVAFGGRIIEGQDDRKFINSRESPIYRKGELLFGVDAARDSIRKSGQALLVEGYFDAIALHQHGIRNTVALCSASLTAEQVKLLRRFEARELVLVLDGDEAGRRGVARAAGPLLAMGMPARVVVLPAGVDPDEHVLAVGAAAFRAQVEKAPSMTEHLIATALPEGSGATFEQKLAALAQLQPILAQVPEGLERSLFVQSLSRGLGVDERDLRARLGEAPLRAPAASPAPPTASREAALPPAPRRAAALASVDPLEEVILVAHLLVEPELARLPPAGILEELAHPGLRAIAAEQIQGVLDGQPRTADEILEGLDAKLASRVRQVMRIVLAQAEGPRRDEFQQKCRFYRQRLAKREEDQIQRQLAALAREITAQRQNGRGPEALQPLLDEHLSLIEQKKALALARRGASLPDSKGLHQPSHGR